MNNILIVDDEKSMREFLAEVLSKEGFNVFVAKDGVNALAMMDAEVIDLAIVDLRMPGMSGLELLDNIKEKNNTTSLIMITAFGSEKTAVEAMKRGACNYIKKPFESLDELLLIIKKELDAQRLKNENIFLKQKLEKKYTFQKIIGTSAKMNSIFEIMSRVAELDSTILITGESGTGKELVASAIHYNSSMREKPFIAVSCGALPENLLESELFGHAKGAFTGAVSNKIGLFELAHGGTFFLDEIGEAPPSIQVKLLRVLQSKTFKRVGGTSDIKVDVRIISATNKNLEKAVVNGSFREDLFYRLNVIPIHIPPLRERQDDIKTLIDHFTHLFCDKYKLNLTNIEEDVYDLMIAYPWPGNVRQLENVIERMIALVNTEMLTIDCLPKTIRNFNDPRTSLIPEFGKSGINLERVIEDVERKLLMEALEKANGSKTAAADLLNISFRSLRYRLRKYDLETVF